MFLGVLMLIAQAFCYRYWEFKMSIRAGNTHEMIVNEYYKHRLTWTTSNLGAILFKNIDEKFGERRNRNFVILMWKHWDIYKSRLAINHKTNKYDPLHNCPIRNCEFTEDEWRFEDVDAVIVYIFKGDLPPASKRNRQQRWIFFSDESPVNSFAAAKRKPAIPQLANMFNWSMTYRSDSDVPIPYGRTIPLPKSVFPPKNTTFEMIASLVPFWESKRRDVLVTVLMSHCIKHRIKYIKHLWKLIKIDFFGKCSYTYKLRRRCPGHFNVDCGVITNYLFYLVLENTSCRQYITEKLFYNALMKGAIPIIRNPILKDCQRLLPPNSFIHIDNYGSPAQLAEAIKAIGADEKKILSFHVWRNHFNITNEHGFFGSESLHCCRVCQALNYNSKEEKIYDEDEMRLFLDERILCNTIGARQYVPQRRFHRKYSFEQNITEMEVYRELLNAL